ncbi:hypothetical protein, partial [Allosalinactinospora lopnorensis]|uniref:hypothetical protein n=1 Tax=Allosalinactinospora lopnorensis TaxID=1352348 RepID=UPI001F2B33F9
MVTPEPSDPSAPTHRIEPATQSPRPDQGDGRTRWVTQILRPRNGSRAPERPGDAARTAVLPARTR